MANALSPEDALGVSRIKVWRRLPYFTELLFKLKPVSMPGLNSVAVDEGLRLYYDPELVTKYGVDGTPWLLAHEVQHIMRNHPQRARALSGLRSRFDPIAGAVSSMLGVKVESFEHFLNIMGDFEINDDLERAGWDPPEDHPPATPKTRGLPGDLTMEEYAVEVVKRAEKLAQKGGSGGGQNSGGSKGGANPSPQQGGGSAGGTGSAQGGAGAGSGPAGARGSAVGSPNAPGSSSGGGGGGGQGQDSPQRHQGDGDAPDGPSSSTGGAGGSGGDAGGPQREQSGGAGNGFCGSCAGHRRPFEADDQGVSDVPPPATQDEVEIAKRQAAHSILEWKSGNSRGDAPGAWLLDWARDQFKTPEVPWQTVLARHLRGVVSAARSRVDYRYGPPSRRRSVMAQMLGDEAPLMPVLRGPEPRVVFVLDTSGSMGGSMRSGRMRKAASEALGIVKNCKLPVYGIAVDAAVQEAREVRTVEDLIALGQGGGGTDMALGITAAGERRLKADVIVCITDGITPWPEPHDMPRRADVVTVIVNEDRDWYEGLPSHLKRDAVYVPVRDEDD